MIIRHFIIYLRMTLFNQRSSTKLFRIDCYQSDHVIENMGRDLIINGDSETLALLFVTAKGNFQK